jgi:hypothetical protein
MSENPQAPQPVDVEPVPPSTEAMDVPPGPAAPPPAARSQQPMGCYIAAGIIGVALVVAALLIAAAIGGAARTAGEAVDKANPINIVNTVLPAATPTILARPPAILQVRAISDLATAQTLMSTIVEAEKARVGNVIYEKLALIACGRVKAGIDLTKLKPDDVVTSADGMTVTVKLPKAQLLDVYLIDDSTQPCTTRVYDRTNLIFLAESKELEGQAREKAVEAISATAVQSGILSEATRNAKIAIERVLLLSGYENVVFIEDEDLPVQKAETLTVTSTPFSSSATPTPTPTP